MATSLRGNRRVFGRAARRRDEPAARRVGALFDEFAPMVLSVCRYHLRDPQAAEDAAQETFLSAHRSLLGGTRPRDPAAWLATIARNECRRTRRTAPPAPLDEDTAGPRLDPADIAEDRSDLSDVASAIAELPGRQREALILREFCGLSYEQVAAAMSVSDAAVDSLLSRARRRLVEQLGEIPRAAHGTIVVPASLREELARLIPGLETAGTAAGAGVGGVAAVAGLGSSPVAVKIAATGAAAVVLAVPAQTTVRADAVPPSPSRTGAAAIERAPRHVAAAPAPHVVTPAAPVSRAARPRPRPSPPAPEPKRTEDSSGPGSGGTPSASSGPGPSPQPAVSDSSGPGSGSGGSKSSGAEPSRSASSGPGSGSNGPGSSGSDSSGSGSSGSGSTAVPTTSGTSGSRSSGSGSGSSGSGSSGSGSSGSGSSGSGSGDSGSSGSGSGHNENDDD